MSVSPDDIHMGERKTLGLKCVSGGVIGDVKYWNDYIGHVLWLKGQKEFLKSFEMKHICILNAVFNLLPLRWKY